MKPRLPETFTLSNDPHFVAKGRDVVRLFRCPPQNAIVRSVDEKSQVQVSDRTQPLLPIGPGEAECRTLDDVCNGTTSRFATGGTPSRSS